MLKGKIFHVQRYTIHDGPGIRTEIFFKGCPLRCKWCSNPEGYHPYSQPGIYPSKCIGENICGYCKKSCPCDSLLQFEENKILSIHRDKCYNCMKCVDACPADAIKQWGKDATVDELMEIILKDTEYFNSSGGGVTLSGGEPLQQSDFITALLKECKRNNIHTCVETTLFADWPVLEKVLLYTDLIITDLKHMNAQTHKTYTGVENHKILDNMMKLSKTDTPFIIRIPVIPTVNDDKENMKAAADFILDKLDNRISQLQLLEYMHLGVEKYKSLNLTYPMDYLSYDKDKFSKQVKDFSEYFQIRGISCIYGTNTTNNE